MPPRPRIAPGGMIYHALNRAVARLPLFEKEGDYLAFEEVLAEAMEKHPTRLLSYTVAGLKCPVSSQAETTVSDPPVDRTKWPCHTA